MSRLLRLVLRDKLLQLRGMREALEGSTKRRRKPLRSLVRAGRQRLGLSIPFSTGVQPSCEALGGWKRMDGMGCRLGRGKMSVEHLSAAFFELSLKVS